MNMYCIVFNVGDNETNLIKIRYRRVDDLDLVYVKVY